MLMFWLGVAIVIMTFWLIFKNYEARIVLTLAGALMALIGGNLGGSVNAFVKELVNGGLVPTITIVMGFGALMVYTKCLNTSWPLWCSRCARCLSSSFRVL